MAESLVPTECQRSTGELHTSQQAHIASVLRDCMFMLFAARDGAGNSSFLLSNIWIWFHWSTASLPDLFFFLIKIVPLAPKQTGAKRNISFGHSKLEMY